jgi:hypothetical protein
MLSWKEKEDILNKGKLLKGTNIFINEDFSKETVEIRKELQKEVRRQRELGKFSTLLYDRVITRDFKARN